MSGDRMPVLSLNDWQDFSEEEIHSAALAELERAHDELQRIARIHTELVEQIAAAVKSPSDVAKERDEAYARRIANAKDRHKAGKLGLLEYFRIRIWIATKSRKADAPISPVASLAALDLRTLTSEFLGYGPVKSNTAKSQYLRASIWALALEPSRRNDREFLDSCRKLAVAKGNISEVLDYTHKLEALKTVKSHRAIRQVEGRLREISGWVPRIPGPVAPVNPVDPTTVLHLVKESRPYHSNGFTSRSHSNFRSELAAGLNPVVLTELGFPRSDGEVIFPEVETIDGIPHHRLDFGPNYVPAAIDQWLEDFAWAAYQKVKEIRPAVIHVGSGRRGYETALVGLALKNKTGLPLVYEVRSFFEGTWTGETAVEDKSEIFARRMAVEEMCMRKADHVLTIGEAMKAEIISRGIPADKVSVVPNGVDLEKFDPLVDVSDLRATYGINGFTFGYVSNMDHHREAQETLIDVAKILKGRGRQFQCVLVGSGRRLGFLQEYAAKCGVSDSVIFTGSVDHNQVSGHYALIDAFVVPRIHERASKFVTPLKPYEAMAMRRPVIGSDLPALREILAPPTRGLIYEPGNLEKLADAIEFLAESPAECARLSETACAWLKATRQWSMNGPIYADVFENVQRRVENQEVGSE
ncbi:glycosyltransferase family 4 protein [Pseudarthrobacter sp. J75]|uniref:glycosyltransferase family 4 protein n=1 Tax=Pseudarthrobacter sp. J75 TaxID=3116486 RepID=UPI002E814AAC|nr:glycosyltransferase family 4 protein [Pseudarthrobacter sp. J75]MEE2528798.1 glycosyltransferase family 4 protein [Pseudarthrobacter sp. J75]